VPLITGQIRLLVTLSIIIVIQGFEAILVLTNGGPGFATEVPALRTYDAAFSAGEMGYASSVGLLLFLPCLVLTLLINRNWTLARTLIAALPLVPIFLALGKFYVEGLVSSGLKL
jgi:ABC-type sugar transport system permease subunit